MPEIDQLFNILISKNGSDLHLEEGQKPKIRLHGKLVEVGNEALTREKITALLLPITLKEDWQKFRTRGDLNFAYAFGQQARFRVNYYQHFFGFGAVFRLIPFMIRPLEDLGLPPHIKNLAKYRSGLILVTGPTGSGKSTTLAAIIDYINSNFAQKIITIEEPVEFTHHNKKSLISHREVGKDTASFASGLRTAIKSDANIILVGEMHDQETIELALTASETERDKHLKAKILKREKYFEGFKREFRLPAHVTMEKLFVEEPSANTAFENYIFNMENQLEQEAAEYQDEDEDGMGDE